jgi:hypothetical protein
MNKLFKAHTELTEADFSQLWEKGLFVFDTNILLDLYRLPETAKKDLLNILSNKKINKRVWLPFQVVLEFTHNKLDAISDQKNKFNSVRAIVGESITEVNDVFSSLTSKLNELQLKKRHSVINPDPFVNENLFKSAIETLDTFLKELDTLDKKQPDVNDKDELKCEISKIFENKIGSGFSNEELGEIFKEGELRYKDNIPPGYKDRTKEGFYLFEDKRFIRKFGDLVVWKEIIKKAKDDNLEYMILITGDTKEDWWQEKRGKKLGPRYELLNEIYFAASGLKVFHMYDTSSFLLHSKQYLKIDINDQSIKETKDLIEYNKLNEQIVSPFNNEISIMDYIKQVSRQIPIKVHFPGGFEEAPFLNIPNEVIHYVLMEIFMNVVHHSLDRTVTVRVREEGSFLVIRFKNLISHSNIQNREYRGKGLDFIRSLINEQYGFVEAKTTEEFFQLELFIEKRFTSSPKKSISLF